MVFCCLAREGEWSAAIASGLLVKPRAVARTSRSVGQGHAATRVTSASAGMGRAGQRGVRHPSAGILGEYLALSGVSPGERGRRAPAPHTRACTLPRSV